MSESFEPAFIKPRMYGVPERGALRGELGRRLRALRLEAGLSGRELGRRAKMQQTTISKWESGKQRPTDRGLIRVLDILGADEVVREELLRLQREVAAEDQVRHKASDAELKYVRSALRERASRRSRWFCPIVLPDLLQVAGYLRVTMADEPWFEGIDTAELSIRQLDRQAILFDLQHEFTFLIAEATLYDRRVPPAVTRAQIDRMLSLATLPNITLGIIPADARRPRVPWTGFGVFDESTISLSDFTGAALTDAAGEVTEHIKIFEQFADVAYYQHEARALLERAADTTWPAASP
jgi:transcriptional regulator with XRE-family HTH domain